MGTVVKKCKIQLFGDDTINYIKGGGNVSGINQGTLWKNVLTAITAQSLVKKYFCHVQIFQRMFLQNVLLN